jgi:hypothetical protein
VLLRFYAYYTAIDFNPILLRIDRVPQIGYDDAVHPHQSAHDGIGHTPARACASLDQSFQ